MRVVLWRGRDTRYGFYAVRTMPRVSAAGVQEVYGTIAMNTIVVYILGLFLGFIIGEHIGFYRRGRYDETDGRR